MTQHSGNSGNTVPFIKPIRNPAHGGEAVDGDALACGELPEWREIIRQQPDINISRTVLMHRQLESGRYRIDPSRVARRLLRFEQNLR